jgi:SAM-dependent methyltransferase
MTKWTYQKVKKIYQKIELVLRFVRHLPVARRISVSQYNNLCQKYTSQTKGLHNRGLEKNNSLVALDIGCGSEPRNPFKAPIVYGIDIREGVPNIRNADLVVEPIPFPDSTIDYLTAYDFIEHVPRVIYLPKRRFPFVELMNEVYRVLKTEGIFLSHTPVYPYPEAFRDPTHVNIITADTFPYYFCGEDAHADIYGFKGRFKLLEQVMHGAHLISIMQKIDV